MLLVGSGLHPTLTNDTYLLLVIFKVWCILEANCLSSNCGVTRTPPGYSHTFSIKKVRKELIKRIFQIYLHIRKTIIINGRLQIDPVHGTFLEEYHATSWTSCRLEEVLQKKVFNSQFEVNKIICKFFYFILSKKCKLNPISKQTLRVAVATISQNSNGSASTDSATNPRI